MLHLSMLSQCKYQQVLPQVITPYYILIYWPLVTHPFFWWVTGGPSIISQYLFNLKVQIYSYIHGWMLQLQVPI